MGKEHPMVPVPEAIHTVLRETARVLLKSKADSESSVSIDIDSAWDLLLGRVLEKDVHMVEPGYPPYNASIMDGYAIRSEGCQTSNMVGQWTHEVVDKVFAGGGLKEEIPLESKNGTLAPAYYITTGAVVPDDVDCVVPIEECQVSEDKKQIRILPTASIHRNKWIRPIGCDIQATSVVLSKGDRIDPIALGLLKQSGAKTISVKRPLVVGVLSTGNELILGKKDDAMRTGMIPDVNRPILCNLLKTFGESYEVLDLGNERDDDLNAMATTIDHALEKCDVTITTGGISMGESDIVEKVLVEHCGGKLHFGRMHMKPGKPTTFVTIPKGNHVRLVFAMPGNPVSAIVCTQLLVKPCLDLFFHGVEGVTVETSINDIVDQALVHPEIDAKLSHDIQLDKHRPEYHRVTIGRALDGSFEVATTGTQRSSRLMSCRDAQAVLVLPVGSESKPKALKGESYPVLSLGNLRGIHETKLNMSRHLAKRAMNAKVALLEVIPEDKQHLSKLEATSLCIQEALSRPESGQVSIVSKKVYSGNLDGLYDAVIDSNGADFVVVCCPSYKGAFRFHLDVSTKLRAYLEKPAKSLALQARQGAAAEAPEAALFEVVTGYAPENQGALVICLPETGVRGGLANVRGLLKHALTLARGQARNSHERHDDRQD